MIYFFSSVLKVPCLDLEGCWNPPPPSMIFISKLHYVVILKEIENKTRTKKKKTGNNLLDPENR